MIFWSLFVFNLIFPMELDSSGIRNVSMFNGISNWTFNVKKIAFGYYDDESISTKLPHILEIYSTNYKF